MMTPDEFGILLQGVQSWNEWRNSNPDVRPTLRQMVISLLLKYENASLSEANFSGTDLNGADLSGLYLVSADLRNANLVGINLSEANITGARLYGTARDDWKIDDIKCDYVFWDWDEKNEPRKTVISDRASLRNFISNCRQSNIILKTASRLLMRLS